jgi:hypothetical protein
MSSAFILGINYENPHPSILVPPNGMHPLPLPLVFGLWEITCLTQGSALLEVGVILFLTPCYVCSYPH